MKAYGGVDLYIHIFLTSGLAGVEWSASRPIRFTPGERASSTHWIGGSVDPRAGLDDVEKRKYLTLLGLELRCLGRPAHSQSLCRLRYPGSKLNQYYFETLYYDVQRKYNLKNLCAKNCFETILTKQIPTFQLSLQYDLLLQNNTDFSVPSFILPSLNSLARFLFY
jgi:hypothetical protein